MEIIVVGGSYAGLIAALRMSRELRGRARVRLITDQPRFVQRIRLHESAARAKDVAIDLEAFLWGTGVDATIGRVSSIDLGAKRLTLAADCGTLGFDRLALAVGSRTDRSLDGALEHAFTLDDPSGSERLRARLAALSQSGGGRVAIVGGGLTAIEAAAEIADAFPALDVELLAASALAEGLAPVARRYLATRLAEKGVEIMEGVRVLGVDATSVSHGRGQRRSDASILCAGFVAPSLAREAGLAVNDGGQMLVDPFMRSVSHPFVQGAGDAAIPAASVGAPIVMACRTAGPMARHAADQLAREIRGLALQPMRFADTGRCVSLGRSDGLVTVHRSNGQPTDRILTGRLGALLKEAVCRFTVAQIHVEAWRARLAHGRRRGQRLPGKRIEALLPFGTKP